MGLTAVFDPAIYPSEIVPCNCCGGTTTTPVVDHDRYGFPTSVVECPVCGLQFISPRMTAEGYAAFYEHGYRPLVDAWMTLRGHGNVMTHGVDDGYAEVVRYLTKDCLPPSGHLVDVGGSHGVVSRDFAKHYDYRLTVIDPAPNEIVDATGDTICAPVEDAVLPAETADVILCCRTLDHLLDPKLALTKMAQWIAPNGVLICDVMNVPKWHPSSRYKVDHPYAFSMRTAVKLLRVTGWRIKRWWTLGQDRYVGFVCVR